MRYASAALVTSAVLLTACSSGDHTSVSTPTTADSTIARPFDVFVPKSYDSSVAAPLVVSLHGYGSTGAIHESYFKLQPLAEERGFLYVHPDGTKNDGGEQFWNATDACCGGPSAVVDDSAYLTELIESVQEKYNVDSKRIYVMGHSNGGFMSYRMACDHADKIAVIASLAGATFADTQQCKPSETVSVLEIHGTDDQAIDYAGFQSVERNYPGAKTTTATWAAYDGCGATPGVSTTKIDLEPTIPGAETTVAAFPDCPTGSAVELWTIDGGSHSPTVTRAFMSRVIDFMYAHPKP